MTKHKDSFNDLTGKLFGKLKVIKRDSNSKRGHVRWDCLVYGKTVSCGCSKRIYGVDTIDRMNNDLGYIIDNVVPCCKWCNLSKRERSKEEFLEHNKKIYEYQLKKHE